MSAVLSTCFQEPPVFKIKKHLYPPSLGVELEDSNRFTVSMPIWVMKSAHELETHMPNVPRDVNLSQLPTFKNGNILHSSLDFSQKWDAFPMEFLVKSGFPCPPETEHVPFTFPPPPSGLSPHPGARQSSGFLIGPCGHLSVPLME